MKLLILGDPHGHTPRIRHEPVDAVICTGDFIPDDTLRRVIFSAMHLGISWRASMPEGKLHALLRSHVQIGTRVLGWLSRSGRPTYIIPGNWDLIVDGTPFYAALPQHVTDCDSKLVLAPEFSIIGYGGTSGPELRSTPPRPAEKAAYRRLRKKYDALFARARRRKKPIIFLIHNPPYGTALDKVRMRSSPAFGKHVGSQLARDLILRHKPTLCICGHMHENAGFARIGKTLCLNAGCLSRGYYYILESDGFPLQTRKKNIKRKRRLPQ